ncbi:MAG: carboxypeptidase regulatory-like domain-containing protein, partial [Planctomycetota bacterium]
PEQHELVLRTRMNGRADVEGSIGGLEPGVETLDTGDIPIPRGARLLARVIDERGAARPGVTLRFLRQSRNAQLRFRPRTFVRATSDAGGALALDVLMECGTWSLHASREYRLIEPAGRIEIIPGPFVQEAMIVVRSPDPSTLITGRVIDTDGRAVPNIRIQAEGKSESSIRYGATGEDGRFLLQKRGESEERVQLSIRGARGFEDLRTVETYAWGSKGIVLTLERAGKVMVTVLESDTGRPVEDYRLGWCKIDDDGSILHGSQGSARRHQAGRVIVEDVPRGRIRMAVTPSEETLAPGDPLEFVKGEGQPELRIELERRIEVRVQIVLRDGRPVPGTELELLQAPEGQAPGLDTYGMDPSRYFRLRSEGPYALSLDRTRTDAGGHATLRWPVSGKALAIRVLGPGHVPVVRSPVVASSGGPPIRITVDSGATVTGVVGPLSVLEALGLRKSGSPKGVQGPTIVLTYTGSDRRGRPYHRRTECLDAAGAFRFTGLRPGTWNVMFRVLSFDSRRVSNLGSKQFAPLTLGGSEQRRVDYDISDLRPAVLRGQVVLDGIPVARRQIDLRRVRIGENGSLHHAGSSRATTDGSGSFSAGSLPPGRYRVSLQARGQAGRASPLACNETVDLVPGSVVSRVFHIRTGGLELHVSDAEGKPVAGRHLVVHDLETGFRATASSDAQGLIRIERIAAGSYTVSVKLRKGGLRRVKDVTVAPGPRPSAFRITLPEK